MELIQMSETLVVSRIVLGLMRLKALNLTEYETLHLLQNVVDLGITTFDHADIYGDYTVEKLFGDALSLKPSLRNDIQIITKCGIKLMSEKYPDRVVKHYDTSREHIINSVNNSLKNFKTDYIDLLLIHRPDPFMDPLEVVEAFQYLYKAGKVLNFGVSNFKPSQFNLLQKYFKMPLVTNQIEVSPVNLENFHNGTIELCQEYEISPMAYSPLGGGRIFNSNNEIAINLCSKLEEIAKRHSVNSLDEVIYAWILMHRARIIPVIGTLKLDRIRKAIKATSLKLSLQEWFEIYRVALNRDVD